MGEVVNYKLFVADKAALEHLKRGPVVVDLNHGEDAISALLHLIDMSKRGLCKHTRLDQHRGEFRL